MNILISIAVAWLACQAIKILLRKDAAAFFEVGGMPSAHSTLTGALATAVAFEAGFASIPAAITYVLLAIVVHDALHIRKHHNLREIIVGLAIGIIVVSVLHYI